jgi:hypothetical protein
MNAEKAERGSGADRARLATDHGGPPALYLAHLSGRRIPRRFMIPATFSDEAKRNVLSRGNPGGTQRRQRSLRSGDVLWYSGAAGADIAIASGYAGPEGGVTPAGTVWFAWNFRGQTETKRMCFAGDCETVVAKAVRYALAALSEKLAHWQ